MILRKLGANVSMSILAGTSLNSSFFPSPTNFSILPLAALAFLLLSTNMRVSSLCLAIPFLALNVVAHGVGYNSEFYTLGCPESTKPYASQEDQLKAIIDYGKLLYLEKKIEEAESTYVAKDFINHAPEVPGNGTALAIETLSKMLPTSTIQIQNQYVGVNVHGVSYSTTFFKGISSVQGVGAISDQWRMIGTCKFHFH